MSISRIASITVPVADIDRALVLYRDTLGFSIFRDLGDTPESRAVHLTAPGGGTTITLMDGTVDAPAGSLRGAVLQVRDIAAALGCLRWGGVTEHWFDAHAPGGPAALFADADGNVWTLWQPAEVPAPIAA